MSNSDTYSDRIIIDWIAFTTDNDFEISDTINLNFEWLEMDRGMLGYKSMSIENTTKIKWLKDGNSDMGQHYIISGQSCRILESLNISLLDILRQLNENYTINITRLDIAMDIFENKTLLKSIVEAYNSDNYRSKAKSSNIIISKDSNGRIGTTINFGSRQSAVLIRIYDKAAESDMEVNWVRIEIECKDKKYNKKIINNINNLGLAATYKAIINNYLAFLEYRDANISRSKTAKWWNKIIDSIDKIKLYEAPKAKTLDEIKRWLINQTSASFATVLQSEQSRSFIDEMLVEGTRKMKNKHWNMV